MDQLPTKQELRFRRERKELYERLVVVIQGLSAKFPVQVDSKKILEFTCNLQPTTAQDIGTFPYISPKGRFSENPFSVFCVLSEISHTVLAFWKFIANENGFRKYTKATREGIERLEWLRDNWEHLTVMGNLKDGYELGVKL